jgi:hypothetical protein
MPRFLQRPSNPLGSAFKGPQIFCTDLPRIPAATYREQFDAFTHAGRGLSDLHLGYETAKPYPLPKPSPEPSTRTTETRCVSTRCDSNPKLITAQ